MRVLGKGRQRSHRIDGEGERGCQSGCCWHLAELERGSVGTLEESRSWSGACGSQRGGAGFLLLRGAGALVLEDARR